MSASAIGRMTYHNTGVIQSHAGWLVAWPVTLQREQARSVPTARIWN